MPHPPMPPPNSAFEVSLSFQKAQLPPFSDILVLGRKCPVGTTGIRKSMEYLIPNNFDVVEIPDATVEAIVINRVILSRMPIERVLQVLRSHVFPFMCDYEVMRVDFSVRVSYQGIQVGE